MSPQPFRKDSYRTGSGVRHPRTPGRGTGERPLGNDPSRARGAEHFTGKGGLSREEDAEVRAIAERLAAGDADAYRYLWSAAAYLLRCDEELTDEAVKAEARRRTDNFDATMARNAAKRAEWAKQREAAA